MEKKKLLSLALAGAMSVTLLAGCGGGTTPNPAPSDAGGTTPNGGDTPSGGAFNLSVCIASEPQTIDPALNSSVDGAIMTQHVFEGLMKWGDTGSAIGGTLNSAELVNGQAASYEKTNNSDGTVTYTFTLRDDIKWSDGQPVTAGDFEYAWKRLVTPATAADYANMASMILNYDAIYYGRDPGTQEVLTAVDAEAYAAEGKEVAYDDPSTLAVTAKDDKTLEVILSYDCPYFLEIAAFPSMLPVRKDIIEANPDGWTHDPASYIGNGAYKMTTWDHNSQIIMEKNPEYYDYANLGPETITFKLMDDQNAMLNAYNSDELQFINDMPVDEIPTLLSDGKMDIVDYIGTYYVCYQTQKAPFDDWRVRKAFTLAIDSKYIVEKVTQSGEVPATGFVAAGIYDAEGSAGADFRTVGGDYWNAPLDDATYQANLEEANKLLDEAGYEDRSTFPVVTYLYNTSDNHKAIGEALQSQWKNGLGVEVKLENQDWSVFLQTRKDGDYEIARNGWISDYNDPMAFLDMWVTGGGNNDAQYSNPEYDAAIREANSTSDPAARMAAMHKAEDLIMGQDWALGPIYFYTQKFMLKSDVHNAFYTPLGYYFFMYATRG